MKLLFVYNMPKAQEAIWMDGLWMALLTLEKDIEITKCNLSQKPGLEDSEEYDFILGWGAFNSPVDLFLQKLKDTYPEVKMGLCIAGNAFSPTGANKYDVLFYETKWYRPQINFHPNIVHAFGINADIFNEPMMPFPIVWDYIGVGSLSLWKRWEKMKDKKGQRLVVGQYQIADSVSSDESLRIANDLLRNGIMVSNSVHPFDLQNLYHWSKTLYIPANINGGGERAILEARACGLSVEIEEDNEKLHELLTCPVYTHEYYAQQLKKGIEKCL